MKIAGAYDAGANYVFHRTNSNSTAGTYAGAASGAVADTQISLANDIGNAANKSAAFVLHIQNPASTALSKLVYFEGGCLNSAGDQQMSYGSGHNTGTGALTGIRFQASTGNITSGTFRLYGIANS